MSGIISLVPMDERRAFAGLPTGIGADRLMGGVIRVTEDSRRQEPTAHQFPVRGLIHRAHWDLRLVLCCRYMGYASGTFRLA